MKWPEKFYIETPNKKIWDIAVAHFKENGIKWSSGRKGVAYAKEPLCEALGFNYWNDKTLTRGTLESCGPLKKKLTLEEFLSLEFAPQTKTFKLNAEYSVEIQKGKVIIRGGEMEGRSVANATIRKIAALEDKRFLVRAPSQKVFNIIDAEIIEENRSDSKEKLEKDWQFYKKDTVIDWNSEFQSADYYKRNFPNVPYISLEELLSRNNPFKQEKIITIGPHEVWRDGDEICVGCQRFEVKVVKELAAKLI